MHGATSSNSYLPVEPTVICLIVGLQMGYTIERVASVEQLVSALRRYLFAAVHWIEALSSLAQIENVPEKVRACPPQLPFQWITKARERVIFKRTGSKLETRTQPVRTPTCTLFFREHISPKPCLVVGFICESFLVASRYPVKSECMAHPKSS